MIDLELQSLCGSPHGCSFVHNFSEMRLIGLHCFCRPAPIKVGACRALAQLFPQVEKSLLRPHLGPVYVALGALLQEVTCHYRAFALSVEFTKFCCICSANWVASY